jgi:hypothetical protein
MTSFFLFLLSVAICYFVFRYRIHVIVVVDPRPLKRTGRVANTSSRGTTKPPASRDPEHVPEITAALVNLGCKPKEARLAAERACGSGAKDFDTLLRVAIQEAVAA